MHCGWHEPILPGGNEIAAARGGDGLRSEGRRVGFVVGMVGLVVGVVLR